MTIAVHLFTLLGVLWLGVLAANFWRLHRYYDEVKKAGHASLLARVAWALSAISLLVIWVMPVSLVMALVDSVRQRRVDHKKLSLTRVVLANNVAVIALGAMLAWIMLGFVLKK